MTSPLPLPPPSGGPVPGGPSPAPEQTPPMSPANLFAGGPPTPGSQPPPSGPDPAKAAISALGSRIQSMQRDLEPVATQFPEASAQVRAVKRALTELMVKVVGLNRGPEGRTPAPKIA